MSDIGRTESSEAPTLARASAPEVLHVVVGWCTEQPALIGYAAPVQERRLLGRGGAERDDPAPRLVFGGFRPSGQAWAEPFGAARLSRRQLLFTPRGDGTLGVESVGRCPMIVDGEVVRSAVLGAGDTLVLHELMVLLVVARRVTWFLEGGRSGGEGFAFGGADGLGIVGESPAAWDLRASLGRAALAGAHVLVHGASGTGKELAARAIHALSPRRGRFVARNAATVPEGLIDAELFGNAKNYPQAGMVERAGLVGEADGGTLFLDEIGEMRHELQAHLLRVMDRGGEYQRLGEARTLRADLRVVGATNRPLSALKHDFAARLPVRVALPGLNERPEDIPLLVRHLIAGWAKRNPGLTARFFEKDGQRLATPPVEPALVDALIQHEYTLHVRELDSVLWTALCTSPGDTVALTPGVQSHLADLEQAAEQRAAEQRAAGQWAAGARGEERERGSTRAASGGEAPPAQPGQAAPAAQAAPGEMSEREAIEAAMTKTFGNVKAAAELLGMSRHALQRRLKRYGLRGGRGEGGS